MENPKEPHRRQFISFSFYRVLPEWRRLPLEEREDQRREFGEVLRKWNVPDTMRVLTYSLVGIRRDADLMLWRICYSVNCLQDMASDLRRTRLGGYLVTAYSFLGMTRRSEYLINLHEAHATLRGVVRPGGGKYLSVFPMVRTRDWYLLPFEDRQRAVQEMMRANNEVPGSMQRHVIYSFGLDDQDFVVALEADQPEEFVERMMQLRETVSSRYTQRDTPVLLCAQSSIEEMLEKIG